MCGCAMLVMLSYALPLAMLSNAQQRYAYEGLATLSNVMSACAYLCLTMLGHGYPWLTMGIHSLPWISMVNHGYPWSTMEIHA